MPGLLWLLLLVTGGAILCLLQNLRRDRWSDVSAAVMAAFTILANSAFLFLLLAVVADPPSPFAIGALRASIGWGMLLGFVLHLFLWGRTFVRRRAASA